MALPNDYATAMVKDGELLVIDGRGNPWKFDPGKYVADEETGKTPPHPDSVAYAFIRGERLYVIDGSDQFWALQLDGTWKQGSKLGDGVDPEDASPWVMGANMAAVPHEEAEASKAA